MRCDRRQFRINYWQFNRLLFMRRDISNEVKTNQLIDRSTSTQQFGILNVNVKRVGRQPVQMMMFLAMVAATRTQGGDITGAEITVLLSVTGTKGFIPPASYGMNIYMVLVGESLQIIFP